MAKKNEPISEEELTPFPEPEELEAPVRSPEPETLPMQPISRGESSSLATIRARKDAHLANLRR